MTVEFEPAGAALDASVGYKTGDIFVVKEHQTGHELYDPMINRHEILPRIITDGEHIQPGESCILISTNILYVQKRSSSYAGTHKQHATQVIQLMSSRGHVGWYSADSFEWQKLNGDKG